MKTLKHTLKYIIITIIILFIWAALIVTGSKNGWWHEVITDQNTNLDFIKASEQKVNDAFVGNFALALINNGKIENDFYYSKGKPINKNTVFQVASLSKWVSSFGIMKLVQDGDLDLDAPVNKYLTRWQLPNSAFNNDEVTVRRLLSHTAGLTDGLGYSGFKNIENMQTLEASLTKALDADNGISGEVKVGIQPGTEFMYSGGGFTLLQLIVEEVTGQLFSEYMKTKIFKPLGMHQSTYVWNESSKLQLAEFYNANGTIAPHFKYTSLAATSLYTSMADLEIFFNQHLNKTSKGILTKETIKKMRAPHATSMGMDIWGLGTILYTEKDGDYIIGHDGKSSPPINTAIRLNPVNGNGIIVLETGNSIMASSLASEWVYWSEGKIDLVLFTMKKGSMISTIFKGWIMIIILMISMSIFKYFKRKKNQRFIN